MQDIYGAKRGELLTAVQSDVAAKFATWGFRVEGLSYAGPLRLPQTVQQQITNRIANEQEALAAQANVATATANANAAVAPPTLRSSSLRRSRSGTDNCRSTPPMARCRSSATPKLAIKKNPQTELRILAGRNPGTTCLRNLAAGGRRSHTTYGY